MSNDEAIVSQLVKSRERCRQLVQLYRGAYEDFECRGVMSLPLAKAFTAATQLVAHLRAFPGVPVSQVKTAALRMDAEKVLMETSDLLQGLLVIERELRESVVALRPEWQSVSA
ncbi:MAG: hypothetical protein WCN95_05500 [bacterium]